VFLQNLFGTELKLTIFLCRVCLLLTITTSAVWAQSGKNAERYSQLQASADAIDKDYMGQPIAADMLTAARAQISEESALAVKKTVQSQLAAFAADDAELAFSYAAPGIQKLFKTSDNFMSMVQQTYPVVYRPANILFLKAKVLDSIVVQPVRLWDQVGGVWLAAYDLERQADGRWLITACVLVRDKSAVDLTTLI